jgi:hypothetical protein
MTYAQDQLITQAEYNAFRSTISNVYGVGTGDRGYGQTVIPLPAVTGGSTQLIDHTEWQALHNSMNVCANHQFTSIVSNMPLLTAWGAGHLIKAHPPAFGNVATAVASLDTNRLNVSIVSNTVFSNLYTQTKTPSWSTQIQGTFTATFASGDAARYFFNSGGEIRFTFSLTGFISNTQDNSWAGFLSGIGTVAFRAHSTQGTRQIPGLIPLGYYDLTTGYQKFFGVNNPDEYASEPDDPLHHGAAPYATYGFLGDDVMIEALSNGVQGAHADKGSVITFRVTMKEDHYGGGTLISGTTGFQVSEYRATTYLSGVSGATYATLSALA